MYNVIVGKLDAPINDNDFYVFGPFDTKEAADTFIAEWFEVVGDDEDAAKVISVLDPVQELAQERKELAEALGEPE